MDIKSIIKQFFARKINIALIIIQVLAIIMFLLSFVLRKIKDNKIVLYAFFGIRAGVLALIINALIKMYKQVNKNIISYIIMIVSLILTAFFDVNAILVIILCGIVGLISTMYVERSAKKWFI